MRIVTPNAMDQRRMLEILRRSMELKTLDKMINDLGIGAMQPGFIAEPTATNADGRLFECQQEDCEEKVDALNTQDKSRSGLDMMLLLQISLIVVGGLFACGLALSCFWYRRRIENFLDDGLKAIHEKRATRKDDDRRLKRVQEHRDEMHSAQFVSAGVKPGEFLKTPVKRSVNIYNIAPNVSKSRFNGKTAAKTVDID